MDELARILVELVLGVLRDEAEEDDDGQNSLISAKNICVELKLDTPESYSVEIDGR